MEECSGTTGFYYKQVSLYFVNKHLDGPMWCQRRECPISLGTECMLPSLLRIKKGDKLKHEISPVD